MTFNPVVESEAPASLSLAIVGMAGRFPGARTVADYWRNVVGGVKSIRHFSNDELLAAGVDPTTLRHPSFVAAGHCSGRRRSLRRGVLRFDAA